MEFRILGTLEVIHGHRTVDVPRAKPRALLAMLVIHANQVVSADRLIDALWGEHPPPSATNTLQGYVSQLRQTLATPDAGQGGLLLRTQAPGYVLSVDPERVDARRFEHLVAEGRRAWAASDPVRAAAVYEEALRLWRGPVLAEFEGEAFRAGEATRLEELRLAATEEWAAAELALGHHARLVGRLQAIVAEHPLRERLWGQLMVALYRCGRQVEALRAFQTVRRLLAEELGIDPGPELRSLEADILAHAPALGWQPKVGPEVDAGGRGRHVPFPRLLAAGSAMDYVGREALLASLDDARRRAFDGACRAVLLAGEPGVGKTRTVGEVARLAFADGATVLYGRCDEDVALPYQPFAEALDWYTTHAVDPVLGRHPAELTRLQPLLASRVADLGPPVSSDPRSEEYLLFEATTSWIIELARRGPLLLVLDDLHWATKPVVLLLRHLLRRAAAHADVVPLLVLGTYRDTEVGADHPLIDVLADRRGPATVERMTVVGLSPAEVEEFVSRAVGQGLGEVNGQLTHTLYSNTEGNPFFLHEVLRDLAETAGPAGESDRARRGAGLLRVRVPEGVRDVVAARIGRLPAPTRELLAVAGVLGADFDVELLAALVDLPESDLLEGLDRARRARVIEETGADRYRFAHALVRATLVEALSATRLRRLHRRVAEAIEKLRPHDVGALAHHFAESGPDPGVRSRAVRFGLAAAEQALAARALADAELRFRGVLALLDESPELEGAERVQAMCGLGEAQRDQGDPEHRITLLAAARLAQQSGDVGLLVRAALSNSRELPSVIGGLDAERVGVIESALAAVGGDPSVDRALLVAQLAAEISFTGDDRRRLALAGEAESLARRLGDDSLLARVLNRTGYAAFDSARVDRLVARGEEATRLSDASGDTAQRVVSRYFWSGALLTAGEIPAFRTVTRAMLAVAEEAAPTFQWLALASQPRVLQVDGDMTTGQRLNQEAFQRAMEIGEPDGVAWWTATDTMFAWSQGRFSGPVIAALQVGMEVYPTEPAWSIGYAMALAMEGAPDEARTVLRDDPPAPDELLDHAFPFLNTGMCGVIAFHTSDADLAARTASALRPHRRCWIHHYVGSMGPVALPLALCAAVAGDFDDASALCEEAERTAEAFGCLGVLPRLQAYHAEILLRRGSPDDRLRAGELLDRARRGAEAIDGPGLVAIVDELAARVRTP